MKVSGKLDFIGFLLYATTFDGTIVGHFEEPLPDGVQYLDNCTDLKVQVNSLGICNNFFMKN